MSEMIDRVDGIDRRRTISRHAYLKLKFQARNWNSPMTRVSCLDPGFRVERTGRIGTSKLVRSVLRSTLGIHTQK